MKLLGWMHRKFRQNNDEPFKDFAIDNGRTSMNGQQQYHDQQYYFAKPVYGTKFYKQTEVDYFRNSFTGIETLEDEENSEIFHGFLAIGTLGSDHEISTTPSTPTFAISFEENGKETEEVVTETQLKLLEDNLEKILEADVKEEFSDYVSSGRNSYVSAGRSSQGSTITLSGKTLELPESYKNGGNSNVCPLQGYLFGSAIELPETKTVLKKEHRTSLKDLFQKSKIIDEFGGERCEKDHSDHKSAVKMMKKMLKRKVSQVSRNSTTTTTYGSRSATSGETKLKKILHIFHKKVHPESSNSSKKHMELPKEKLYSEHQNLITAENGTRICYKNQINPETGLSSVSNGNREFWIKSDEDYLVLEL